MLKICSTLAALALISCAWLRLPALNRHAHGHRQAC